MKQHSRSPGNLLRLHGNTLRVRAALSIVALGLLIGCAHGRTEVVECPAPSPGVSVELHDMMLSGDGYLYDDLLVWIGEIERHCSAVSLALE